MTNKRFERVYGDVEVVCIDHQKTGDDKFIDDEDYDKFVDLLNELDEKYIDEFSLRETLQLEVQRLEEENKKLKLKIKTYNSTHELLKETIDRLRSDG